MKIIIEDISWQTLGVRLRRSSACYLRVNAAATTAAGEHSRGKQEMGQKLNHYQAVICQSKINLSPVFQIPDAKVKCDNRQIILVPAARERLAVLSLSCLL